MYRIGYIGYFQMDFWQYENKWNEQSSRGKVINKFDK